MSPPDAPRLLVLGLRTARIGREAELLARLVEGEDAAAGGEPQGQGAEAEASRAPSPGP